MDFESICEGSSPSIPARFNSFTECSAAAAYSPWKGVVEGSSPSILTNFNSFAECGV